MDRGQTWRTKDNIDILILGRDELEYIYYCAFRCSVNDIEFHINFVPIHEDMLKDFTYLGDGQIVEEYLEQSKKSWLEANDQSKSFFTISPGQIMMIVIHQFGNFIDKFKHHDSLYVIPCIFPTNSEILRKSGYAPV